MAPEAHLSTGPPSGLGGADGWPGSLVGEGGRRLFLRHWEPPGGRSPGRSAVVLVNGFAEHSGRYDHLGAALAASGRATWAMDLRGHGRSEGPRADIERLEWALADLDGLVDQVGGKPIMFGHSLGGALAAAYATTRPARLSGVVLSAAALHLVARPAWQVWPVRALAAIAPGTGVARVPPAGLSHDPERVAAFVADPLVFHGRAPARTAFQMYRAGRLAYRGAAGLTVPLLVVHGDADPIVPVSSSQSFFAAAASPDKQLAVLRGLLHEPHQERGRDAIIARLVDWVARH